MPMRKRLVEMEIEEMRTYFRTLGRNVESHLPPGPSARGRCLFVLLVVDETEQAQYLSNCSRENMVKFLRETAERLERREDNARE